MSKQAGPPKEKPKSITINFSGSNPVTETEKPREPKQSHICIFGDCKKGKRGGTDYCRTHKPLAVKQKNATATKHNYDKSTKTTNSAKSTKKTSTKSTKNNNQKSGNKSKITHVEESVIQVRKPILGNVEKAIFGIILMVCGPIIASQRTIFDSDFFSYCTCCFILMGAGFSLIVQSLHKDEVKISTGIYYFFLFFALIIIFMFAIFLFPSLLF